MSKHHHMSRSTESRAWINMRYRCRNPKSDCYARYGGRGIKVCERWRNSFVDFYADMGPKTDPQFSIERTDNDGHYSCGKCDECLRNGWPMNCRWAIKKDQSNNTRSNVKLEFSGQLKTIAQWAAHLGIKDGTIRARLYVHGWPVEKALSNTVRPWGTSR